MKRNSFSVIFRVLGYLVIGIIFLCAVVIYELCDWIPATFGVELEAIIYTITSPLKGTGSGIATEAVLYCLPSVCTCLAVYILYIILDCWIKCEVNVKGYIFKKTVTINLRKIFRGGVGLLAVIALVISLLYTEKTFLVSDFLELRQQSTKIYEEYYVDSAQANIVADGNEKNVICIYLESMETTYASIEEHGYQAETYIPNLVNYTKEGIMFSDSDGFGGFHNTTGTGWTMAALLSMTSGVPFAFPVQINAMSERENFAPGLTTMGDVLEEFGYNQEFLCGSDATFGGRRTYFEQHGNYEIYDLYTAREEGYIPDDYYVWWGFEDKYLFEIAKNELLELSSKDEPFNFTMLTVDAHHDEGYVCDLCQSQYDSSTANVLRCTDTLVYDFIEWCKQQYFYENTVIVIVGDHPRMDVCLVDGIDYYNRTMYNCILNTDAVVQGEITNRVFTSFDMFPTILTAMGFEYDGNRLGLGTDMFSEQQTLAEELGYDILETELSKYSEYYLFEFN